MLLKDIKIISIDPGFDRFGVAVLEKVKGVDSILFSDCLTSDRNLTFEERLILIMGGFEKLLKKYKPELVAMEQVFINQNKKSVQNILEIKGAVKYICAKNNVKVFEMTPQRIKMAVTGYGFAKKEDVIKMVQITTKHKTTTNIDDEYDAVACGLAALAYLKTI